MSIQVIHRLTQLLDTIARYDEPVSLKILSAETGLHTSTAFRILASLIETGFIQRQDGNYQLGPKLAALGHKAAGQIDLVEEARPLMRALRDEIDESVNLTIQDGDEVVYVGRELPKRMIRVEQIIGSRAPLHVTAVGKLMLGLAGETAIRNYAQRTHLPRYTTNTITDEEKLVSHCLAAASRGNALDNEEAELGVGCIGVTIQDDQGHVIAGLSLSAPVERRQKAWGKRLLEVSRLLSQKLGYRI